MTQHFKITTDSVIILVTLPEKLSPSYSVFLIWKSPFSATMPIFWLSAGQRYDSNGSFRGSQFQVNTYTTSFQYWAEVSSDSDGDFVVVWQSNGSNYGDTSGYSIQGRRYPDQAVPVLSPFFFVMLLAILTAAGLFYLFHRKGRSFNRSG
ncbi:hypothetical protein ACFL27_27300 [candidate division CSSED10-310 bacterium]|uniref:Uncharacterized protein n=1 Tax=candidate division CSSED10-310 bacterium TaxID=2855610 RepID=A0ABV6Z652_UNCC1